MYFPVFQVLDFIEKHIKFIPVKAHLGNACIVIQKLLKTKSIVYGVIDRKVTNVFRVNASCYQLLNGMMNHYGLADSSWPHQYNGSFNGTVQNPWKK